MNRTLQFKWLFIVVVILICIYGIVGIPRSVADIAKEEMLDTNTLNRCVKFVEKAPTGFEMMRKPTAQEKEVSGAAVAMQKQVRAMIGQKGKLDKMKQQLLNELSVAMRDASIFGLGQAAPNTMTTVMKFFPSDVGIVR